MRIVAETAATCVVTIRLSLWNRRIKATYFKRRSNEVPGLHGIIRIERIGTRSGGRN
jgi:hypothetical protein